MYVQFLAWQYMRPHSRCNSVSDNRQAQSPMTSGQRRGQRTVPVPSTPSLHNARDSQFSNSTLAEICVRMGLKPFELTRDEAVLAKATPGITQAAFSKTFGDIRRKEWPIGQKVPGYKYFLCMSLVAQPFMPTSPGKPGLVILPPATVPTAEDDNQSFHVFSSTHDNLLFYSGEYMKVNLPQIELKWSDLSRYVRTSKLCYFVRI